MKSESEPNVSAETLSDDSEEDFEINNIRIDIEQNDEFYPVPYGEVGVDDTTDLEENSPEGDPDQGEAANTKCWRKIRKRVLFHNLFPDDCRYIIGWRNQRIQLFDSIEAVRVLKFVLCTALMIVIWNSLVPIIGFEHDSSYSIRSFFLFDFGPMILDCVTFAIVGRLYKRSGVDRGSFIIPTLVSCVYGSWSSNIWFLRNSLTLYNMACTWPWQLWLYALLVVTGITTIFGLHVRASFRDGSLMYRFVELLLLIVLFLMPVVGHPSLHLHHYFTFWLLGMIFNRDEAWSQFAMAIAWGHYVNGISCYGRDNVLSCAYSNHVSAGNYCFSNCPSTTIMQKRMNDTSWDLGNTTRSEVSFVSDWRKCNAH